MTTAKPIEEEPEHIEPILVKYEAIETNFRNAPGVALNTDFHGFKSRHIRI